MELRTTPGHANRFPSYLGVGVCEAWHTFSTFRAWVLKQRWEGRQLDKDLLGDGKLYSPQNCCFVTPQQNSVLLDGGRSKNTKYPQGITLVGKRYRAAVSQNNQRRHIGYFDTVADAKAAWIKAKKEIIQDLIKAESDIRIKRGLRKYMKSL